MATISSGQITIIDLYDAPALNAWISASQTTTQTYNNTTNAYSPNFGSSAQVLTLNLTKAGSTGSLISSAVTDVKWKKTVGATTTEITSTTNTDSEYKSGTSNSVLTTKVNVPTANNAVRWTVEGTYTDPDTSLPITFQATIDINLIQLAKAAVVAVLSAPNGDYFRNSTPASLKLTADVYKDGDLSSGSRKYKWFAADSSVTTSQDMVIIESTGGNILKNGVGSTTLTARLYQNGDEIDSGGTGYTYKWSKWQNNAMVPNFGGTSNPYKTGKSLSVGSADVDNTTTFKVEVENK